MILMIICFILFHCTRGVSIEIQFDRNPDWFMEPKNWSYIYEMSDFDMACMLIRLRLIANDEFKLAVLKVKLRLNGEDNPQNEIELFMNDLRYELAKRSGNLAKLAEVAETLSEPYKLSYFQDVLALIGDQLKEKNIHVTKKDRTFYVNCSYGNCSTTSPRMFFTALQDALDLL